MFNRSIQERRVGLLLRNKDGNWHEKIKQLYPFFFTLHSMKRTREAAQRDLVLRDMRGSFKVLGEKKRGRKWKAVKIAVFVTSYIDGIFKPRSLCLCLSHAPFQPLPLCGRKTWEVLCAGE